MHREEGEDAVVVCRCEGVTWGHIRRAALASPGLSLRQLKLVTRVGMGMCQARVCRPLLASLARSLGLSVSPQDLRVRPPLRPVSLGELAGRGKQP
jgi:bacterioferritin-associated ferredoxin